MAYRKLGRNSSARKALFRDLVTDLFINERIETTEAKAKAVRPIAEKLITLAKRGDLHARRQVASYVRREQVTEDQEVLEKLFSELATRYTERPGGYTRILKLGPRRGDSAPMVYLELVDGEA
ncbi:50S ribosomal protein L17 [Longirhabdus pacifica]|uniref:50S ribosomal protein L17 n=1 Tax=Longirhabdus pacifica TaxID=2305227 RepID=UPI001008A07F|nr:50S ribosomal protein L17 [Longirhabdus pacifica]